MRHEDFFGILAAVVCLSALPVALLVVFMEGWKANHSSPRAKKELLDRFRRDHEFLQKHEAVEHGEAYAKRVSIECRVLHGWTPWRGDIHSRQNCRECKDVYPFPYCQNPKDQIKEVIKRTHKLAEEFDLPFPEQETKKEENK